MNYNAWLHRFAVFTACCTFFLIVAGGLVTSTGSGLAVPDWPLSYGKLMPPMVGGIFYEHGHRMVATFVGFLTVILAVWLWKKEQRRWLKILGFVALGAVITQGLLGGLTVLYLLPTAISVSHATLAQTFFCLVASIALFTSRWWHDTERQETLGERGVVTVLLLSTLAVYLQLILGAVMRHTGSGLAVPDFPLAYGQLLPSLSPEALQEYNRHLILEDVRLAADGPITASQILLHLLHRFWAIVVTALVVWAFAKLRTQADSGLKRLGMLLPTLLVVQIGLGAWTVLSHKAIGIATSHVAVGALILVIHVLLFLRAARLYGMFGQALSVVGTEKEALA